MPRQSKAAKGYGVVNQSDGIGLGRSNFAAIVADEVSPLQGGYAAPVHEGCFARLCHGLCSIPLPSVVVYLLFWGAFILAALGGRQVEDVTSGLDFGKLEPMLAATHGLCGTMMTFALLFIAMTTG